MRDDMLDPIDLTIAIPERVRSDVENGRLPGWWRYRECDMQWAFEAWLREARPDLEVDRELLIAPGQRPDFVASYRIGGRLSAIIFELKYGAADMSAVHQIRRYAQTVGSWDAFDVVSAVLVAESFHFPRYQPTEGLSLLPVRCQYEPLPS